MFSIDGYDHATAHVEGPVHLACFDATNVLQPFKLGVRLERCINMPSKLVVKPQQVR